MGSGCTGQNSALSSDRIRQFRQGNLTFFIHGNLYTETKTAGKGCRRTVAWHTNLTQSEITEKIKEFWETRVDGSHAVWAILKQACELQDPSATEALLKANNLTSPNGLLQQTFDSRNHRYDLPPFVINLPLSYGKGENVVVNSSFDKEKILLIVRSTRFNDLPLECFTTDRVEKFRMRIEKEIKSSKFRVFYAGKELKIGNTLGSYGLKDKFIVQVFLCD